MIEGVALMINVLLLPDASSLALLDITVDSSAKTITAVAATTAPQASCPACQQPSSKVQSRYVRTLADLPCSGQQVRWLVQVRRFWCLNAGCPRQIFSERLPTCAPAYARRTSRQAESLHELALTAGGKGGAYLAQRQGMPASRDTLLRLTRRRQPAAAPPPRVLGVDDFAWRRGHTYGTILINLETHQPVDVLEDRSAETFANWLRHHPGVEVISRDRSKDYQRGATDGAPTAQQVLDRWHVLKNLREAVERFLNRTQLQQQAQATNQLRQKRTSSELARREGSRQRRLTLYNQVMALHQQGGTISEIARRLHIGKPRVRKFIAAKSFPEWSHVQQTRSAIDPYRGALKQLWDQGCRSPQELWQHLQAERGFSGGYMLVYRWAQLQKEVDEEALKQSQQEKGATAKSMAPRHLSWSFLRDPSRLEKQEQERLSLIRREKNVDLVYSLAQQFVSMVKERKAERLSSWLGDCQISGITELVNFAQGLEKEGSALHAALTLPYSNGQTEGQINRLKLLKRQAYGRAQFDLLRLRVLHRAESPDQQKCA
jgi:transposase